MTQQTTTTLIKFVNAAIDSNAKYRTLGGPTLNADAGHIYSGRELIDSIIDLWKGSKCDSDNVEPEFWVADALKEIQKL